MIIELKLDLEICHYNFSANYGRDVAVDAPEVRANKTLPTFGALPK